MEISVEPSKTYAVTTSGSCTVTDADGLELCTASSGSQAFFVATTPTVTISDDGAKVSRATFNYALAVAGLLGGGADKLPAGYTRVDFLENTGTQYLVLPVEYGQTSGLSVSYKLKPYSGYSYLSIIRYSGKSVQIGRISGDGNTGIATSSPTVSVFVVNNGNISTAYNADASGKIKVASPDEEKETDIPHNPAVGETVTPVYVFAYDTSSSLGVYTPSKASYSLYEARFTQGKQLVHKYIPALSPAGEPCMFDLVSKQAFRNAGTGQFVVGMTLAQVRGLRLPAGGGKLTLSLPYEASIDKLAQTALEQARANGWELTLQYAESDVPAGYRKLDFLESTGTQFIDTDVQLSSESTIECSAALVNDSTSSLAVYGSYSAGDKYALFWHLTKHPSGADSQIVQYRGLIAKNSTTVAEIGKEYLFKQTRGELWIDGKLANTIDADAFSLDYSAALFCTGHPENGYYGYKSASRVYSFSISSAGEMQVDYVPCITPEGKLGMYNRVDGTLQENDGTGSFIAGLATVDDVRNLWLPETNGELTVSVPADTPDSAVEQMRRNNPSWQIAIQYRTDNEN